MPCPEPATPPPCGGSSAVAHGTTARVPQKIDATVDRTHAVVVCGGGGSDGEVNDMSLAIRHHGCTELWLCTGPKKNPPRNSSNLGTKTLSMSCNCGETTVFPTRQRACQQPCPSTDSDPTSTTSRDIDHQSLHTKGHVNDIVQTTKNCNCGSSAVSFTTVLKSWTGATRTSTTLSMYCRRISMSKSSIHNFLHYWLLSPSTTTRWPAPVSWWRWWWWWWF